MTKFDTGIASACVLICAGLPHTASAALVGNAQLSIGEGSFWAIETGAGLAPTAMLGHDHLLLGTAQSASIGHAGPPNGTESPGIDQPSEFFNYTTLHQTTSPVVVLSAAGNTAALDFTGWEWVWHSYSHGTNTGAWNGNPDGVAQVVCAVDCGHGDSYVLDYSGVIAPGSPSGIGGERYQLHLEGTVSAVPLPAALPLFLAGLGILGLCGHQRPR